MLALFYPINGLLSFGGGYKDKEEESTCIIIPCPWQRPVSGDFALSTACHSATGHCTTEEYFVHGHCAKEEVVKLWRGATLEASCCLSTAPCFRICRAERGKISETASAVST